MEKHFCPRCDGVVEPVKDEFLHPDKGRTPCLVCPTCRTMVFIKETKHERKAS